MLTTPIDAHLPLVIALVLACAWVVRGTGWAAAVQCAAPLLIVAMMTVADERTRLFAYGIIVAAAFGLAAVAAKGRPSGGWPGGASSAEVVLTIVGIVLLRWIPLGDVHILRELVILAGSIALLFAIPRRRSSPPPRSVGGGVMPAILIAVLAVAVVTPLRPGKMTFFPFALALLVLGLRGLGVSGSGVVRQNESREISPVGPRDFAIAVAFLAAAFFARYSLGTVYIAAAIVFLVPFLERLRPPAYGAALVILALWPWSGVIARALPLIHNYEPAGGGTRAVTVALAASEALPIGVPPHVRHAVVTTSGGQMARLRVGHVVGTIEATDVKGRVTTRPIRIGDMADFGFTRREQFFASRNPLPQFSPGEIRDYGASAWLWGSGRTAISSAADLALLRVIAAPDLHSQAHLQVDSVEFPAR